MNPQCARIKLSKYSSASISRDIVFDTRLLQRQNQQVKLLIIASFSLLFTVLLIALVGHLRLALSNMKKMRELKIATKFPIPKIPDGRDEREKLSKDPESMLNLSISRNERLPEDLHTAMVMWSFHPEKKQICKFYLDWIETCEDKDDTSGMFRRVFEFKRSLFKKENLSWMMSSRRP